MIGSTIAFAKAATSARNSFSSLRTLDTEGAVDAGEWGPRAGDRVSNALLVLEAQELSGVSQETSTANERHLVSKARMEIMRQGIEDVTTRLDLQQFDSWSFGRKLAYARSPQDYLVAPGRGLPTGRSPQDEVRDPHSGSTPGPLDPSQGEAGAGGGQEGIRTSGVRLDPCAEN